MGVTVHHQLVLSSRFGSGHKVNERATNGVKAPMKEKRKIPNPLNPLLVAATECPNTTNFTEELRLHPGVVPKVPTCTQTMSPNATQKRRWRIYANLSDILPRLRALVSFTAPIVMTIGRKVTNKPSTSDNLPGVRP
jgi:hypothetical protein